MLTFQSSNNIIITKRSNYSSLPKNSDKKEKTSNNFYKTKNKQNYLFNKTTLSLSTLKLKSKSNKTNKNIISPITRRKISNANSPKKIKSKPKYNKKKFENKNIKENFKKSKSNQNVMKIYDNNPLKKDKNNINNENLQNNILLTITNDFNHYPVPEPMPIKISKNNNIFSDRGRTSKINNYFNPSNILSNIDLDKNEMKYNNYEKLQSERKYYSNLQKFFENNSSKELKKHKKNNINLINNNNFQNFIQNINNINNNENYDNYNNNYNNAYDKKMIFILSSLDLDNIINKFNYNCINFNDLFLLTKQDLIEMKIPIGQRNRLMHFLDNYKIYAKNYDFNEIKKYLDMYKNIYANNAFIDKCKNADTMPNFIDSKNYMNYTAKNRDNNSQDNGKKNDLFFKEKIINKKNEAKKFLNNNILESDINNKTKDFEIDNSNLIKTNLNSEISNINNIPENISNIKPNKKEIVNISTFQRNISNIDSNKNYPTFSSISNSKGTSMEEITYQDNNAVKKNNKKSYSTITTNIELSDTAATSTTLNNKIKTNHFLQKCNNLLNEVDNFNTIYSQLKQKSQNRNKQISLLLNKKNNFDYYKDRINYNDYNEINLGKEKTNQYNEIYNDDNYYLNECDFNELNSLQEESTRDLNKELKLNLWK